MGEYRRCTYRTRLTVVLAMGTSSVFVRGLKIGRF